MIGIVIVAHGGLAREYLAAIEHVVGAQAGIRAITIEPEDDRDAKKAEIIDAAASVDDGDGVVLVTDMFGGTPSNLSMPACAAPGRKIVHGANLPLLIKLAKSRAVPLPVAIDKALAAGRKYIGVRDVPPAAGMPGPDPRAASA